MINGRKQEPNSSYSYVVKVRINSYLVLIDFVVTAVDFSFISVDSFFEECF